MVVLSALFILSLLAALLTGAAMPVYTQWTGGLSIWPVVLPCALMGGTSAWLLNRYAARWVGNKMTAGVAIVCTIIAFSAFGDTAHDVKTWSLLALRIGLDYATWHQFVMRAAILWFGWVAFLLPFLWMRIQLPRARLTTFVGMCCGLILARILNGCVSASLLYDIALAGLLPAAALLLAGFCKSRLTQGLSVALGIVLLMGWYFGMRRSTEDLRRDVYPFAPIAERDGVYTGEKGEGFTFKEGRLVRSEGLDVAARIASQLLPTLFFPGENARIAVRAQTGDAVFSSADCGELKGAYQALWVEVPPAWTAPERDYYGKAALQAVLDHLTPDGVLVYDNDAHALDATMLMRRIAVMRKYFDYVQLWMTDRNHWQIIASRMPLTLDTTAMSTLLDRPEIATVLAKANIETPLALLASCVVADTKRLDAYFPDLLTPNIPRGSAATARRLLFDGIGSKRIEAALKPYYDMEMPWVKVPDAIVSEMRLVITSLRSARILAFEGEYAQASQANPSDPYLQSLAERECFAARSFERMAEHEKALQLYISAFAIAKPRIVDVLEAANIARTSSGDPTRAEPFYRLAVELMPTSPDVLMQQAQWLFECKRYAEAEKGAREALKNVEQTAKFPDETAQIIFFMARAINAQPRRAKEGLMWAREVIQSTQNPDLRARFVPMYGQMLIESGEPVLGVRVKRHWEAYGELLPETSETQKGQP